MIDRSGETGMTGFETAAVGAALAAVSAAQARGAAKSQMRRQAEEHRRRRELAVKEHGRQEELAKQSQRESEATARVNFAGRGRTPTDTSAAAVINRKLRGADNQIENGRAQLRASLLRNDQSFVKRRDHLLRNIPSPVLAGLKGFRNSGFGQNLENRIEDNAAKVFKSLFD